MFSRVLIGVSVWHHAAPLCHPAPQRRTGTVDYPYGAANCRPVCYENGQCGGSYFTKGRAEPRGLMGAAVVGYFGPQDGPLGGPKKKTVSIKRSFLGRFEGAYQGAP